MEFTAFHGLALSVFCAGMAAFATFNYTRIYYDRHCHKSFEDLRNSVYLAIHPPLLELYGVEETLETFDEETQEMVVTTVRVLPPQLHAILTNVQKSLRCQW